VNNYSVKSVLKVLTYLAEVPTLQKSLIKTDLALNIPTSLMMMMMMMIIIIIIIMLLNFRSTQKRRPVDRRKNHTHKHAEDSFKEHTFKITSAIQTPIREISVVAIVLQNQAINMQRVSPFIRQKDTEL